MNITPAKIEKMIYIIRGQKVILDSDLAELYEVETKNLNKAVKRNISRFPEDFMFQLNSKDLEDLRFQIGTAKSDMKKRFLPYAFTENGVAMLSGILNSERAVSVNISIMRTFTRMRSMFNNDEVIFKRVQEIEKGTNKLFRLVFEKLDNLNGEVAELKTSTGTTSHKRKIGLKT